MVIAGRAKGTGAVGVAPGGVETAAPSNGGIAMPIAHADEG
jgi:hypothetical protein